MKQQFLDLKGLTELVGYLKDSIANKKVILPYASNTLFPSVGDINSIYIDTATNSIYRWNSTNKKYEMLAKAVKSVSISESTENGKITLTVDGTKTTVPIHGLKSAAYTESSAYATAGHTHTKAQVGLGNVDNTADKDKSVKHATTADSATNAGIATNVSAGIGQVDLARHVWFSDNSTETKRNYNDNFKYNPATNLLTTNITGSAASASSVPWTGVTGKPSTFTPSSHKHDDSTITSLNASKLFGTIDIARLPQGALERCVIVEDDTARFKLTTANIQLGDTVKVNKTQKMYFVINESKLNSEEGYTVYTAGTATSVPWSGVTGKPSTFTPSAHTHPYLSALSVSGRTITYTKGDGTTGTITTQDTWRGIQNNLTSDSTSDSLSAAQGKVLKGLVDGKLSLSGGVMTGNISYKGTKATYQMIKFIDNTSDTYGNGIAIGGGGLTIIGGGESSDIIKNAASSGGDERLVLANDSGIEFYTNCQEGIDKAVRTTIDNTGLFSGTAAKANAAPWSGITGKPTTYPPSNHTHAYLPLAGGTMTGDIYIPNNHGIRQNQNNTSNYTTAIIWKKDAKGWYYDDNGTSKKYTYDPQIGQHNTGGTGTGSICILPYATNTEPWQQNVGLFIAKNILKLDGNTVLHSSNYNTYVPTKTGTGASGTWRISVTGNAGTATKLATARSINGTNFDGSGNITTATWGTARNITIGNTKKSVNGGSDISWSLSEIGAAAASHTHSYLPLAGGTMTGVIKRSGGGSWIKDRDNVAVLGTSTSKDAYNPVVGQCTPSGCWTIGNLAQNEYLYFNYTTNANYTAGNNNSIKITLPNQSGTIITSATIGGQSVNYANSAGCLTTSAGSATQPVYFASGKPVTTTYQLNATVNKGTASRIAYYSNDTTVSPISNFKYFTQANSKKATQTVLRLWGSTYGNDASTKISGSAGSLDWNDGGPQIQFGTSESTSQDGALIYTDHDSASIGASFHFVSNQTETSVVAKNFVARTRVIINQNAHTSSNQGYNLYVNGTALVNGVLTASGDCNFIAHGNEFNFVPTLKAASPVWFNYRQTGGQPTDSSFIINKYVFGNGANKELASITNGLFSGASTYVRDSNNGSNITITYSKAGQASTSWLASWNGYELGAISPNNITAGKAIALASSAGSATQPVYFSGGKPVACTYTLAKSVPADAKFTDTNTWRGVQNNLTSTATDQSLAAAQGKVLNEKKMGAVSANGYYGMAQPDGNASNFIRTTSAGIIPYQSGANSSIGTSSWKFSNGYIDHMYSTDVKIADKVTLQYDSTNACLNFVFS